MENNKKLFEEFPPVSTQEWEAVIEAPGGNVPTEGI